jgi:hypothetical protein
MIEMCESGRVKPGHDVGSSPAMTWGARVGFSGGWYYAERRNDWLSDPVMAG